MSEVDACRSTEDEVKLQAFRTALFEIRRTRATQNRFCAALHRSPWLQQRSQIRYVIVLSMLAVLSWRIVSVGVYGGPTDQSPSIFVVVLFCFLFFLTRVDAFRVYVHVWALGCFHSLSSSQTFRMALTSSVDSCAEI